jgi:hypothetical protein
MAWTRALNPTDQPPSKVLKTATFDAGNLIANGQDVYNIRRIQNVELVRRPVDQDLVDVYIGYEDPTKHHMFSRRVVDRVFAGSAPRSSEVYEFFRNDVRQIGIPVIDVST